MNKLLTTTALLFLLAVGFAGSLHAQVYSNDLQEDLFLVCSPFKAHSHPGTRWGSTTIFEPPTRFPRVQNSLESRVINYRAQRSIFIEIFNSDGDSDWRALVYVEYAFQSARDSAQRERPSAYFFLRWESIREKRDRRRVRSDLDSIDISSGGYDRLEERLNINRVNGTLTVGGRGNGLRPEPSPHSGDTTNCRGVAYESFLEEIEVQNQERREYYEQVESLRESLREQRLF